MKLLPGNLLTYILVLFCLLFFASIACEAQVSKKYQFNTELGMDVSVGPNTYTETPGKSGYIVVGHYDHARYKLPSFRVRTAVKRPVSSRTQVGIRTGVDVHYLEMNKFGQYETSFTFPLQLVGELKICPIGSDHAAFLLLGGGYRFNTGDEYPYDQKGGAILSSEILLGRKFKSEGFYYKTGFEYVREYWSYDFRPDNPYIPPEVVRFTRYRKLFMVGMGYSF